MKIHFSLPGNLDFFNRYATLIPTIYKIGFFAQAISAITESFVIYSIVFNRIAEIDPRMAGIAATVCTFFGVGFIEIGLRKFIPYSIKAILHKRFNGLDLAMSIFIISVCIGLLFASGALSFAGSKEAIEAAAPSPVVISNDSIKTAYHAEQMEIITTYRGDSVTIANNYHKQITAATNTYDSKIAIDHQQISTYERREKEQGKSYHSRKERLKRSIAQKEASKAATIEKLEREKAAALASILTTKQKQIQSARAEKQNGISQIEATNQTNAATVKSQTAKYGNLLAWFTIVCLVILLLSITIKEIYNKGSQIEQRAEPTQYHFMDGLLNTYLEMKKESINQRARAWIQRQAERIPAPMPPKAPALLYNLQQLQQPVLMVEYENSTPEPIKLPYPNSIPNQNKNTLTGGSSDGLLIMEQEITNLLTRAKEMRAAGLSDQAEQVELTASQVIKCYLGNDATPANVEALRKQIIGFLNGANENPFTRNNRRPIGFQTANHNLHLHFRQPESYDKYTVEHRQVNSDKISRVNESQIAAKIKNYSQGITESEKKLTRAKEKGDKAMANKIAKGLQNKREKLEYWIEKRTELLSKVQRPTANGESSIYNGGFS